jgi:predicted DNA-binding transcriptional regulator
MATPSRSENHRSSDVRSGALTGRHLAAMRLAVSVEGVAGGLTVRRAAPALGVSRATAGAALRTLERAGHLRGELVGGGEIGYTPTPAGRAWLAERGGRPG